MSFILLNTNEKRHTRHARIQKKIWDGTFRHPAPLDPRILGNILRSKVFLKNSSKIEDVFFVLICIYLSILRVYLPRINQKNTLIICLRLIISICTQTCKFFNIHRPAANHTSKLPKSTICSQFMVWGFRSRCHLADSTHWCAHVSLTFYLWQSIKKYCINWILNLLRRNICYQKKNEKENNAQG